MSLGNNFAEDEGWLFGASICVEAPKSHPKLLWLKAIVMEP